MTKRRSTSDVTFDTEAAASDKNVPHEYRNSEKQSPETPNNILSQLLADKKALFGGVVVLLFILVAIFAPYLAPYDPGTSFDQIQPPNSHSTVDVDQDGQVERVWHPVGTDSLGKDVLSRLIFGARVSLLVAAGTVLLSFTVGTIIGIVAGYYEGWVDSLLMRYVDFQWAFPELILAIVIITFAGGRGVSNVILAVGLAYIDDFARLIRGEVLYIREEQYILAAESVGMSNVRIMLKEIFPNAVAPLIVQTTIMVPLAILAEASLSFIGIGVSPTTPTWGILINTGRQFITLAPWISIAPGIAIMITVFGFNLFGDGLRDAFDISEEEAKFR